MRAFIRKILKPNSKTAFLVIVIVAFALGYLLRGGGSETQPQSHQQAAPEEAKVEFWTCAMHPQIRLLKPGKCPICGMNLIPVSSGGGDDERGLRELKLSARAIKLAEIVVAPVERKVVTAEVRMVGKIDYDEQLVKYITAWVPGRIDRLYVDFTGVSVEKGDHMVYLYSPELLTAQEELLQSLKTVKKLKQSGLKSIKETALQTIDSSRERLRLWGLTKRQIKEIERRGKPDDHMTINAPMGGVVIHKNGFEGMYFDIGTRIYTIADLSHLWIMLDAYESDLVWIRYGQKVLIETEAYPGEIFKGWIAFIDPFLNAKTRTVKVRVNVPNPDGRLKPEMFVRAIVRAKVVGKDRVIDPSLAGKWICRMHPEIVKDNPGACDICGMPLVITESLGYVSADITKAEIPLVIPASAPLITGKRALVYVELPGKEGAYEGREIVLGPRAGDYYIVLKGLNEGELVVVNGNFKIDSAIQILAKPSMMSPEEGGTTAGDQEKLETFEVPDSFKNQMDGVFSAYFMIQQALSQDNFKGAQDSVKKLL
ncbi:MAG: efflux RND transporter periplasmic adaptor subunit, partial [bacterium]